MILLDGTIDNAMYDPCTPGEGICRKIKAHMTDRNKESARNAILSAVSECQPTPVLSDCDLTCAMLIYENSKDRTFSECIRTLFEQEDGHYERVAYTRLYDLLKDII